MPTLVPGDDGAAFLDAPGLGAADLFDAVRQVLGAMAGKAVLTVFSDEPGIDAAAAEWCARHQVDLVAVIADDGGTTLALRRAATA